MIKSLKNQLPKQDILQELDPRKPRMALGTRTTAHNRGYGEQAGGGGGENEAKPLLGKSHHYAGVALA